MINFNSMSTHHGIFYAKRVKESHSLYVHIYIFCVEFILLMVQSNTNSFYTDLFDPWTGTLTGKNTPVQSEPGSYGNEGVLHIPKSSRYNLVSYLGHPG